MGDRLQVLCNLEISSIEIDTSRETYQPHWNGPYQELLTNPWAIKVRGIDSWAHMTHQRKLRTLTASAHQLVIWKWRFPGIEADDIWWDHFPIRSRPGLCPFSLLLSLLWKENALYFPNSCKSEKCLLLTGPFGNSLLTILRAFSEGWEGQNSQNSFIWTMTWLLSLTQIHGFWIYNFTSILLMTHLLQNTSFEIVPF